MSNRNRAANMTINNNTHLCVALYCACSSVQEKNQRERARERERGRGAAPNGHAGCIPISTHNSDEEGVN